MIWKKICEGCIFLIEGERKDRIGFIKKDSACLSEEELACGCCPIYEFPPMMLYEGEFISRKDFGFKWKHKGVLQKNVRKESIKNEM